MRQSRRWSLVETATNIAVGYAVAVGGQVVIFPLFGLRTTLSENLQIGVYFTLLSLLRGYTLRRLFTNMGARR